MALPEGDYEVGVRPNHVDLAQSRNAAVAIPVVVELAEINGSETYIHGQHGDLTMIASVNGIHTYDLGEAIQFYLDPNRLFVFDRSGRLVAAPERPATSEGAR
jgi:glycerol transport system ATP-binding protein